MTKRKKNVDCSSEENSASDFELISVKRSVASRRKRRSTMARKVSTDERTETSASDTYYVTPHSRSQHLISSPDLMRPSLLEWYSGVHEVRGMPWRKPFDPSLDADARGQRAYEVSRQQRQPELVTQSNVCAQGMDLGDHASADASRNCDSILQKMDEQVSALITSAV